MVKIAPSILSADFTKLGEEIDSISSADYIHFDVMDGLFVPNISFGIPVLESIRKYTDMILDVHLMIDRPVRYAERFARAGADIIVFHVEADNPEKIMETIDIVKRNNKKVGLSIKPNTPAEVLRPYIDKLDMVLIMTVEPGFGGQSFMENMIPKIRQVKEMTEAGKYKCDIEVDGGVDSKTAALCVSAGAGILVAGSSIFKSKNRATAINELRGKNI